MVARASQLHSTFNLTFAHSALLYLVVTLARPQCSPLLEDAVFLFEEISHKMGEMVWCCTLVLFRNNMVEDGVSFTVKSLLRNSSSSCDATSYIHFILP